MKRAVRQTTLLLFTALALLAMLQECKREKIIVNPRTATISVSDITENEAAFKGQLEFDGGGDILERGFYLNGDKILADNNEQKEFESKATQLKDDTKYYLYAFARNKVGTGYGDTLEFKTLKKENFLANVSLVIKEASNITSHSATLNCLIENSNISRFSFAFEYSKDANFSSFVTINPEFIDHYPVGKMAYADITGLNEETTYYYRLKVSEGEEYVYSGTISFTTEVEGQGPTLPGMEIWEATDVTAYEATLNGFINRNTNLEGIVFTFEYSTKVSFTDFQSTEASIILLANGAKAIVVVGDLTPETTYYFRLKATLGTELAYSLKEQFTTEKEDDPPPQEFPEIELLGATNITSNSATLNALILSKDLEGFEFVFQCASNAVFINAIDKEAVLSNHPDGTFATVDIDSLWPLRLYRYRIKMTYEDVVVYSEVGTFETINGPPPPPPDFPEMEILEATDITETSAVFQVIIKADDISDFLVLFGIGMSPDHVFYGTVEQVTFEPHTEGTLGSITISTLGEGTDYYYGFALRNSVSEVEYTPILSVTTLIYNIPFRIFRGKLYIVTADEYDNVYLGGYKLKTSSDMITYEHGVVAKYNTQGDLLWESLILSNNPSEPMVVEKELAVKNGIVYAHNIRSYHKVYLNAYDSETGELLWEVYLGDGFPNNFTVDNEGYIYSVINLHVINKISPQGQIMATKEDVTTASITSFNDKVLIGTAGKQDGWWKAKVICLDKDFNFLWEHYGVNNGASTALALSLAVYPEENVLIVGEVITDVIGGLSTSYVSKYKLDGMSLEWNKLFYDNLSSIEFWRRRNNKDLVVHTFHHKNFNYRPTIMNLEGERVWEGSPGDAGHAVTNNFKMFIVSDTGEDGIPLIYDL